MLVRTVLLIVVLAQAALGFSSPQPSAAATRHDQAFWQAIQAKDFKAPAGSDLPELAGELSSMLGSEDPKLRDGIAYEILTAWIHT